MTKRYYSITYYIIILLLGYYILFMTALLLFLDCWVDVKKLFDFGIVLANLTRLVLKWSMAIHSDSSFFSI